MLDSNLCVLNNKKTMILENINTYIFNLIQYVLNLEYDFVYIVINSYIYMSPLIPLSSPIPF